MIVWLPFVLYFGIVFSIGDGMSRFLQVIEWVAVILCAMGLDLVGSFAVVGVRGREKAGGEGDRGEAAAVVE